MSSVESSLIDLEELAGNITDLPPLEDKPKANRVSTPRDKPSGIPVYRKGEIAKGFTSVYASIGMALFVVDPECGQAVIGGAEECAKSLEELARTNPKVRKALMSMISASVWSGVIMAHAPIILAIAKHHVPGVKELGENVGARVMGGFEDSHGAES